MMQKLILILAFALSAATASVAQQAKSANANPLAPSFAFPADPELIRKIRSAPEAEPGRVGLYFVDLSTTPDYSVIGIRRTMAGKSELHAGVTDVWYVLHGRATLVSGGTLNDSIEVQPGEFRGTGVTDGGKRVLRAGDFAVIPPGTAHWASEIKGREFIYIVVKIPTTKKE